ncbi:MAG: hypothetical protein LAP87_09455 [Acidobacteriia bacterium]|nr:hypothetical protein [Terriglobia bacterium]
MPRYVILTNRKRAIVALVHSVAFLMVALYGLVTVVRPLAMTSPTSAWVLAAVYVIVSAILLLLTAACGHLRERLYFGFCAASASFGLARQLLGDPRMHAAVYLRVALLACAVATGMLILRGYRLAPAPSAAPAAD